MSARPRASSEAASGELLDLRSLNPFGGEADARSMDGQPKDPIQGEREAQFVQNMGAFMRRDFAAFDGTMRSDVVMELPGSSWLAGTYQGYEEVSRCMVGLRQVLKSEEKRIAVPPRRRPDDRETRHHRPRPQA